MTPEENTIYQSFGNPDISEKEFESIVRSTPGGERICAEIIDLFRVDRSLPIKIAIKRSLQGHTRS